MHNNAPNPSLNADATKDSISVSGDPSDRPTKKPYTRPRFHQLDDVVENTKVTTYTQNGASVCSVNGS